MKKKSYYIMLTITVFIGILMACSCIPLSWGFQQVRNLFDFIGNVGGPQAPSSISWFGLPVYFIIAAFITYLIGYFGKGSAPYFAVEGNTTTKKILITIVLLIICFAIIQGYNMIQEKTFLM